jgi:uncharacterized membrane protein YeaQ/YmgE (transglycosylase-associated protein family)
MLASGTTTKGEHHVLHCLDRVRSIAGFIGSKIVNHRGEGMFLDIILGIVGAVVGGWLFRGFGMTGVNGLNLYSLLVAVIGAVIFLAVYHLIFRRRV